MVCCIELQMSFCQVSFSALDRKTFQPWPQTLLALAWNAVASCILGNCDSVSMLIELIHISALQKIVN